MKKSILIHTIGNRDLQFRKDVAGDVIEQYLAKNTEQGAENQYVIRKGDRALGHTFHSYSEKIHGELERNPKLVEYLRFPLLETAVSYVQESFGTAIDRVLVVATHQSPAHVFDTKHVGNIVVDYFKHRCPKSSYKELIRHLIYINFKDREQLLQDCEQLLQSVKKEGFNDVFISNTAGLPAVSEALNFVGYFQGYQYLGLHAKDGAYPVSHRVQEEILLRLVADK